MTRLRIASLFVAVVAGDYAALMLIGGQLIAFGVAAAICAGSSIAAGLIAYADDADARRQHELGRRRRKAVARGREGVWEGDQQAATAADEQCPLCGGGSQTPSDSPRFVDRQEARLCGGCALALKPEPTPWPVAGLGASSDECKVERVRQKTATPRSRHPGSVGWRGAPDDPGVEVST
jgi:hypothetical protein